MSEADMETFVKNELDNLECVEVRIINATDVMLAWFAKHFGKQIKMLLLSMNPIARKILHWRRRFVAAMPALNYLDERPVYADERTTCIAYCIGGKHLFDQARFRLSEKRIRAPPTGDWESWKKRGEFLTKVSSRSVLICIKPPTHTRQSPLQLSQRRNEAVARIDQKLQSRGVSSAYSLEDEENLASLSNLGSQSTRNVAKHASRGSDKALKEYADRMRQEYPQQDEGTSLPIVEETAPEKSLFNLVNNQSKQSAQSVSADSANDGKSKFSTSKGQPKFKSKFWAEKYARAQREATFTLSADGYSIIKKADQEDFDAEYEMPAAGSSVAAAVGDSSAVHVDASKPAKVVEEVDDPLADMD